MEDFFTLANSNANYQITIYEKLIPLFIVFTIIILLYFNKNKFINNKNLDKIFRHSLGSISCIFLVAYYYLEWSSNGITPNNLPLHLCFISNIFCIILCFTKSKKIFDFVIYTGVLGGLSSLLVPALDLSFRYFRYYQFMICHGSIIIIPLYFFIVHKYHITLKDTISVILEIELLGVFLGIFNEHFNTYYMFVSFTSNSAAKGSILYYIGSGYIYFINLQVIFLSVILIWSLILRFSYKFIVGKKIKSA